MITNDVMVCPICGGELTYYDKVKRILRTKGNVKQIVIIRRMKCLKCKSVHRELPDYIMPYKHYEASIVKGVKEGSITSNMIEYEDYPCEATMIRWLKENDKE